MGQHAQKKGVMEGRACWGAIGHLGHIGELEKLLEQGGGGAEGLASGRRSSYRE